MHNPNNWKLFLLLLGFLSTTNQTVFAYWKYRGNGKPILRFSHQFSYLKVSPTGRFLAYKVGEGASNGLRVFDFKTNQDYKLGNQQVGHSFVWAPKGYRLFYRVLLGTSKGVRSQIKSYNAMTKSSKLERSFPYSTGILSLNPKDLRLYLMTPKGIKVTLLQYPGSRLAHWQSQNRVDYGHWVVSQKGVFWVSQSGTKIRRMKDFGSSVVTFSISPDGQSIAWSTDKLKLFTSHKGRDPELRGFGREPHWHPSKKMLAFAGARMVGNTAVSFDLKILDEKGQQYWLTQTQYSSERWPQWHPRQEALIYTKARTTDLYLIELKRHAINSNQAVVVKRP